jgi:hypothetical protein
VLRTTYGLFDQKTIEETPQESAPKK